ncbi:MAG: phosphatidylglycerol---prolipoprotein diacylglyceryl transferase [Chloroflexota bacterium]|nr:phosphatidylglycerol---prolipoprotein diacylglyceryl transferase [Chloroflexota bacterium]
MTGIVIPVDPIIVQFGPLVLRWYGLMIGIAIVVGVFLGAREAQRRDIVIDEAINLATWGVILGFVFARLFHIVDNLAYYTANPIKILAVNEGGMAIYGGIFGGVLGGFIYAKRHNLPVGKLADAAAPAIVLGQAIGRIGCFFNGDHEGTVANAWFGTMYTNPNTLVPDFGVPRHPTQVYEGLFDLALFGLLWFLRKRIRVDGVLFWIYASLYSLGRFWISFLRLDADFLFGLKEAQVISLVTFMVGAPLIFYLLGRHQRQTAAPQSGPAFS